MYQKHEMVTIFFEEKNVWADLDFSKEEEYGELDE